MITVSHSVLYVYVCGEECKLEFIDLQKIVDFYAVLEYSGKFIINL